MSSDRKKHRKKFKKKRKSFVRKISLSAKIDFSSVKREPRTQRRFSKRNGRTRDVFGIFRVLRLNINLFFGENNVFNMFRVNKKLFEACISFSVQFWNFRFFKKKEALSWPFWSQRDQLVTPAPYDRYFEPKISPIGRLWRDFRTWKGRKVLLQPQLSILRGCPRMAGQHFLTVDYSSLEAPLSFAPTFKPIGWTKRALPENSTIFGTNFPEVPVSSIIAIYK